MLIQIKNTIFAPCLIFNLLLMDYSYFIEHVKSFEGLRLKAYKCPSGVLTIGYGHTFGVVPNMSITKESASLLQFWMKS